MMQLLLIALSAILVNNFVVVKFLGICPFLGVSKKVDTALGMGIAVTFVIAMASAVTYFVQRSILDPLGVSYLTTMSFILVIAALVQFVEMFMKKSLPSLYQALGVYLPLITTNCAVLGVSIINIDEGYNLIVSVVNGTGAALGFTVAIVMFAGVRERLELAKIPKVLDGFPISMIGASLIALAFLGFQGLISL